MTVAVSAIAADTAEATALRAGHANEAAVGSTAINYFDDLLVGAELLLPDELPPEFPVAGGVTVRKLLEESDAPMFCMFEVESDFPNDTGVPIIRFTIWLSCYFLAVTLVFVVWLPAEVVAGFAGGTLAATD